MLPLFTGSGIRLVTTQHFNWKCTTLVYKKNEHTHTHTHTYIYIHINQPTSYLWPKDTTIKPEFPFPSRTMILEACIICAFSISIHLFVTGKDFMTICLVKLPKHAQDVCFHYSIPSYKLMQSKNIAWALGEIMLCVFWFHYLVIFSYMLFTDHL